MSLSVSVKKDYGNFRLDAHFEAGNEALALLGASGCGKSLTLRCVAGIECPDEGRIVLDGRVLFDSRAGIDLPPQQRRVGYLFQQYALFPNMTALQNIAIGARVPGERGGGMRGRMRKKRRDAALEYIERLHLKGLERKYPAQLSGGQQQRVALARILASEPEAILLDEPFSALDSYLKWQLELELADTLSGFPGTLLWVSHDRSEVVRNCGRVCVMEDGEVDPPVSVPDFLGAPRTLRAARLCGCRNLAPAERMDDPQGLFVPDWGVALCCAERVGDGTRFVGVHAHRLHPTAEGDGNRILCRVARVFEDLDRTTLVLQPEGGVPDAALLRMETDAGVPLPGAGERIAVSVDPEDVLLLRR